MVKRRLYCSGPAISLGQWMCSVGRRQDGFGAVWPQLRDRQVIPTFRGRTAVALAFQLLGLKPGDEVMVPSYNCGTELDALLQEGARLRAYRITERCGIDLDDLARQRTSQTRAVYCIHYFGWDESLAGLRRWCDHEGLLLIEDCALALFSQGVSGMLGRLGDAAVFSLPKTLGLGHGGLVSLPRERAVAMPPLRPAGRRVFSQELRLSARAMAKCWLEALRLSWLVGALRRRRRAARAAQYQEEAGRNLPSMPADYFFDSELDRNRALHPRAAALAVGLTVSEIVRRRRSNFLRLGTALKEVRGVRLMYSSLPEGVCPLSVPVLVRDRDGFVGRLQERGIAALPWWAGFHRTAIRWEDFPEARELKANLATLPIHHGLDERQVGYVEETVRDMCARG